MGAATSKSPVRNSRSKSARRVPHRGNSRCANDIAHVEPRVEKRWAQQRLPGGQIEQNEVTTATYHQETQLIHNGAGHRASRKIANHIGLAKVMPTHNKLHTSIMLLLKQKYTSIQTPSSTLTGTSLQSDWALRMVRSGQPHGPMMTNIICD